MKNLLILSIIFFSTLKNDVKNDYIRIKYIGYENKSSPLIYISKKPLPRSEVSIPLLVTGSNYIVHDHEFIFIKKVIDSTMHKTFEDKDFNGFKITFRENDVYSSLFISRKNSNTMFLKINACLMKNNELNKELIQQLTWLRLGNVFDDPR